MWTREPWKTVQRNICDTFLVSVLKVLWIYDFSKWYDPLNCWIEFAKFSFQSAVIALSWLNCIHSWHSKNIDIQALSATTWTFRTILPVFRTQEICPWANQRLCWNGIKFRLYRHGRPKYLGSSAHQVFVFSRSPTTRQNCVFH